MNPADVFTPQSTPAKSEEPENGLPSPEKEETGKKPGKKRKSWGQVLPEPKTNLPPRKRAKTDDEKEQRRVERVLRNRRAAQSSRERKRLEVEALEIRNKELEAMLANAQKANLILVEELNRFRRDSGVVTRSPSPLNSLRDTPLALSQELFCSQDGHNTSSDSAVNLVDQLINSTANPTVNPASLSPELAPVPDEPKIDPRAKESQSSEENSATSPDLTQHPAEMLLDLQCHKSAKVPKSFQDSQTPASPALAWALQLRIAPSASAILSTCQRPLIQIAISLKAGFSLLPTPQLLTTIIWLVTLTPAYRVSHTSTSSTSTTSSTTKPATTSPKLWQRATMPLRTTASSPRSTTLRYKSLRNILSCSPNLARPLMDATMEALRLVSEGCDDRVGDIGTESSATRDQVSELTRCLRGIVLPSRVVLMTLLWALKVEERKIQRRDDARLQVEGGTPEHQPLPSSCKTFVLKTSGIKRGRTGVSGNAQKRFRMT